MVWPMKRFSRLEKALDSAEKARSCLWTRRSNSLQSLWGRVREGTLLAVRPDMFVRVAYWAALSYIERILHILRAVISRRPNWVLSHISAAAVWGLNATYAMHRFVHLAIDKHTRTRDRGYFRFHHIPDIKVETHNGLPVTPLMQTVFDCIRTLPFPEAVAICDAALRQYRMNPDELQQFIADHAGYKGVQRARLVADHADSRSENGGESIARAWMIMWGFKPPELQREFDDPVTGQRRRADYVWHLDDGRTIIGELDGREKYVNRDMIDGADSVDAVLAEKERESNIQLLMDRTVFVRIPFRQVLEQPEVVQRKLDLAGVPRGSAPLDNNLLQWL